MFFLHIPESVTFRFKNRKTCSSFTPQLQNSSTKGKENIQQHLLVQNGAFLKSLHKGLHSLPSSAAAVFDSCATAELQRCDRVFIFKAVKAGEAVSEIC